MTKARTQRVPRRLEKAELVEMNLNLLYWIDEIPTAEADKFMENNSRLGFNR